MCKGDVVREAFSRAGIGFERTHQRPSLDAMLPSVVARRPLPTAGTRRDGTYHLPVPGRNRRGAGGRRREQRGQTGGGREALTLSLRTSVPILRIVQ